MFLGSVLYKTLVYSAAFLLVIAAEKVFHAYRESHALGTAIAEVWQASLNRYAEGQAKGTWELLAPARP